MDFDKFFRHFFQALLNLSIVLAFNTLLLSQPTIANAPSNTSVSSESSTSSSKSSTMNKTGTSYCIQTMIEAHTKMSTKKLTDITKDAFNKLRHNSGTVLQKILSKWKMQGMGIS